MCSISPNHKDVHTLFGSTYVHVVMESMRHCACKCSGRFKNFERGGKLLVCGGGGGGVWGHPPQHGNLKFVMFSMQANLPYLCQPNHQESNGCE